MLDTYKNHIIRNVSCSSTFYKNTICFHDDIILGSYFCKLLKKYDLRKYLVRKYFFALEELVIFKNQL